MRRPDIEVTVDELVVVGLSRSDAELVAAALRRELAVVASAWDSLPAELADEAGEGAGSAEGAGRAPVGEICLTAGMTPEALGSQVAHAVHRHLALPDFPGPAVPNRRPGGHEH